MDEEIFGVESEDAYRYEEVHYAPPIDEFGSPVGQGRLAIRLMTFGISKRTKKGVRLSDGRFVNLEANKRYACLTKEEALESFIRRKTKHVRLLETKATEVRELLRWVNQFPQLLLAMKSYEDFSPPGPFQKSASLPRRPMILTPVGPIGSLETPSSFDRQLFDIIQEHHPEFEKQDYYGGLDRRTLCQRSWNEKEASSNSDLILRWMNGVVFIFGYRAIQSFPIPDIPFGSFFVNGAGLYFPVKSVDGLDSQERLTLSDLVHIKYKEALSG